MLQLEDIQLILGDWELRADTSVPTGKLTALIGPSGAGKSTLLSAIAGFLPLSDGDLLWNDQSLIGLAPGQRPVSVLFQDNNLFPHLSIAQNVGLGLHGNLRLTPGEWVKVSDTLSHVGLSGFDTRKPASLSGGQQSRAALARILLGGRPLVLLDEPFAALGPALKDEMLDLVRSTMIGGGKTVIMVTHDPADAERIADFVSLVADSTLSEPVAVKDILADPPPALKRYLGK